MKKVQRLQTKSILSILKSNIRVVNFLSFLFLITFLNLIFGCSYYKIRTIKTDSINSKINTTKSNVSPKYIVLHSGDSEWHLNNSTFNEDNKEVTGVLEEISYSHNLYKPKPKSSGRTFDPNKSDKKSEVHIYTDNSIKESSGIQVTIPYSSISKIEVYDNDSVRAVFSIVGTTVGVLVLVLVIIAATKSSCPFVYVQDGNSFVFDGEIYPGAILPSLERVDYLKLNNLKDINGFYTLKITNELKEIQKTDLTELVVVNHPENTLALMSQKGDVYSLQNELLPVTAYCNSTKIDTKSFLTVDQDYYSFDYVETNNNPNSVVLEFDNTQKSNFGKLHLNLKNSFWMEYMYGKFNEQFGTYYNTFHKAQQNNSKEKCQQWIDEQNIPLSVYVKEGSDWKLLENINTVGPLSNRDIVIPIPLNNPAEKTQIKLVSGYMFWDLDYAGMDFSKSENLKVTTLKPNSAIDEIGNNVASLLSDKDKKYLVQPNIGNEVVINFKAMQPLPNLKQSFFFKTSGYYEYIRSYTNTPDFSTLQTFREKGALNNYSIELYKEFVLNSKKSSLIATRNE